MTLSITDNILNLQQSPTCKRFLQIGRDYETNRDAGRVSAEVVKTLALSKYEKCNTAHLEWEVDQTDKDFDNVIRKLKPKNGGN